MEVYSAQCNFYGMSPSPDVIQYVEDCVAIDSRKFDFDEIVGISKDSEYVCTPLVIEFGSCRSYRAQSAPLTRTCGLVTHTPHFNLIS